MFLKNTFLKNKLPHPCFWQSTTGRKAVMFLFLPRSSLRFSSSASCGEKRRPHSLHVWLCYRIDRPTSPTLAGHIWPFLLPQWEVLSQSASGFLAVGTTGGLSLRDWPPAARQCRRLPGHCLLSTGFRNHHRRWVFVGIPCDSTVPTADSHRTSQRNEDWFQ